jgi:hypothetical protein
LEASFDLADRRAAVARERVAVIALLGLDFDAVTATSDPMTRLSYGETGVARIDSATVSGTAVVRQGVVVVTGLVFGQHAVTAAGRKLFEAGIGFHRLSGAQEGARAATSVAGGSVVSTTARWGGSRDSGG